MKTKVLKKKETPSRQDPPQKEKRLLQKRRGIEKTEVHSKEETRSRQDLPWKEKRLLQKR